MVIKTHLLSSNDFPDSISLVWLFGTLKDECLFDSYKGVPSFIASFEQPLSYGLKRRAKGDSGSLSLLVFVLILFQCCSVTSVGDSYSSLTVFSGAESRGLRAASHCARKVSLLKVG